MGDGDWSLRICYRIGMKVFESAKQGGYPRPTGQSDVRRCVSSIKISMKEFLFKPWIGIRGTVCDGAESWQKQHSEFPYRLCWREGGRTRSGLTKSEA